MQLSRLTPEQEAQLFDFFTANPPSIDCLGAAQRSLCQRLPIYPTWGALRKPAAALMGAANPALLQQMACHPSEMPLAMQVRHSLGLGF